MELKKDIRKRVLKERNFMTEKEWEEKSHSIFKKVVTHPFFLRADTIYCYVDYRKEVGTREIIQKAWQLGKKVAVPKVEEKDMQFYYIKDFSELQCGYRQILEPVTTLVADGAHGLVIMPGAVFDKKHNRIGYGKGFYDRYLSSHTNLNSLAIAFEMQMVEEIPATPYDFCPEVIITEEQIYV